MLTRKEELFVKPFQQRLYHQHKVKVSNSKEYLMVQACQTRGPWLISVWPEDNKYNEQFIKKK